MATSASARASNRQGSNTVYGAARGSMDVGNDAVTRMAREDARWYVVAVVVLSLVLFLALPISVLVYIDTLKLQSEIRYEIKELRKMKVIEKEK